MNEDSHAIETKQPIAPAEEIIVSSPTDADYEARFQQLESEKNKAVEVAANYKVAYLKEKGKKEVNDDDEDLDDKMRRIAHETLADSRLAEIASEQDAIIKKALKENKELKLAQLNKTNVPPASMGVHNESPSVKDTLVTADQMAAFKAKGWSDKDIERYKKNLIKYGGR